jgi:hypothetical protein
MKYLSTLLFLLFTVAAFGQKRNAIDGYLSFLYNKTTNDRTITNNRSGFGFGMEIIGNTGNKFRPVVQLNSNLFFGTKELYTDLEDKVIDSKGSVTTLFGGGRIEAGNKAFGSLTVGAAFYNKQAYFGLRPLIGIYTSATKKVSAQVSYTTIFQRDEISNQSFGFLSISLGLQLF